MNFIKNNSNIYKNISHIDYINYIITMINYKIIIARSLMIMKGGESLLYIDEETMKRTVTMKQMIDGIEQAYEIYEANRYTMPTRMHVEENENTLLLMPCITDEYITTKLVTVFPGNVDLPRIHGLVVVNCNQTGKIEAIIDGTYLTGARTGAVGGSAVRHLAKENASTLAVIGAGVQGFFQTIAACEEREFTNVNIYNRTKGKKLEDFISKLKKELPSSVNVNAINDARDAIKDADVIITATNSYDPVLPNDESLLKGKLVIGVGSFQPTMREFPEALYKVASKIFVDTDDAIKESGDIIIPLEKGWFSKDRIQTLGSYIRNKEQMGEHDTVVFKSTGSALFDSVTAGIVYEGTMKENTGIFLT